HRPDPHSPPPRHRSRSAPADRESRPAGRTDRHAGGVRIGALLVRPASRRHRTGRQQGGRTRPMRRPYAATGRRTAAATRLRPRPRHTRRLRTRTRHTRRMAHRMAHRGKEHSSMTTCGYCETQRSYDLPDHTFEVYLRARDEYLAIDGIGYEEALDLADEFARRVE